jgi:hypothetical protein
MANRIQRAVALLTGEPDWETITARINLSAASTPPAYQKELPPVQPDLPSLPKGDAYAPMNTSALRVSVELPTVAPGQWGNPAAVQGAITAHDLGNFRVSGLLADAMLDDSTISSTLSVRTKGLTGLPITFKPVNDTPAAKEVADFTTANWSSWVAESEDERLHRYYVMMGAALGQLIWSKRPDGYMHPKMNVWSPQWIYYFWDGENRNFGHWMVIQSTGTAELVGGNREWVFAKSSEKDPQFNGAIRSLWKWYVARYGSLVAWGKWNQKFATAILKLKSPAGWAQSSVEQAQNDLNQISNSIQAQLQNPAGMVVTLPQGATSESSWDAVWEELKSSVGVQSFADMMSMGRMEIQQVLLGQNLTSEGGQKNGGSKAQASVHNDVRQDLIASDAKAKQTWYREQLLKPMAAINFGDPELAPLMEIGYTPDTDNAAKGAALASLGTFLKDAPGTDLIDIPALYTEFGLPMLGKDKT